ncbi:hypothetical protein FRB96_006645 [Tulasnella sp. 330]|nr:hypothetical protein FRB96_006645 [Tulasnella sp. 330]KAG8873644.1 hypothetical protein FRB97_006564 [Tulasnella sp. 331]KAG8888428.1 hypothetical protein FRB98_007640 [Tulasnella sp. 332]
MALNNPLLHHHQRSGSTSSSLSTSSQQHPLYDLYGANNQYPLGRPPVHGRNVSNTSSFNTQLTSPADSPPNLNVTTFGGQYTLSSSSQSAFKSPISPATVARTNSFSASSRRSQRPDTSPYSRTDASGINGSSYTTSRASSSCNSEAEQDQADLSVYFAQNSNSNNHTLTGNPMSHHQHHNQQQGDFSNDLYNGGYVHPHQMASLMDTMSPMGSMDQNGVGHAGVGMPNFGNMTLSPEAALEQLAVNVRSSTTTTASDRAKQIFVQAWQVAPQLSANYAPYPDGNVPRQGLYNSYRRICDVHNIPHINTATLGKAIRLCFPNIKTRRLGVRGNSKYHYCGIRPASVAEAEFLQDFVRRTTNHSAIAASSRRGAAAVAAANASRRGSSHSESGHGSDEEDDEESENSSSGYVDSKEGVYGYSGFAGSNGGPSSHLGSTLGGGGNLPPLSLAGGLKSPTLFSMMDDKTPTTNTLLSMAQAQAQGLGGMQGMGIGAHGQFGNAQIRTRRGFGSTSDAQAGGSSRPGTSGSGVSSTSVSGLSAGGLPAGNNANFGVAGGRSPHSVSVRTLTNFPSIDEALGIDVASVTASVAALDANGSSSPSSSSGTAPTSTTTSPQHMAAIQVWRWFEDHLDALLECVRTWRLDQFEGQVRSFWGSLSGDYREVVHAPAVAGLMVKADAIVYDEILETLRTHMLSPIPQQALSNLKQLAQKMEKILLVALDGYGNTFVEPKVELGARFGHLVLRFLDMFQVTQALTSVLSSPQQLTDMRRAWSQVDFESVRNQSALVCNCRHEDLVQLLENDFVNVLDGLVSGAMAAGGGARGGEPVREVMAWADACCERLMGGNATVSGSGEERATMSSRSVLIRWGYVTSQIMRDLTIRSDPAFGAFQILKLFLDDWIALNVLRSVALSTNSVQASVEPVMLQQQQQQYLALSPMPGQEFTNTTAENSSAPPTGLNGISATLMDQTPTTSSMLAALQGDASHNGGYHHQQQPHQQHPLAHSTTYSPGQSFYEPFTDTTAAAGPFDMSFFSQSQHDSPHHQSLQQHGHGHQSASASPGSLSLAVGEASNALSPAGSATSAGNGGLDVPAGAVEELRRRESEEGGLGNVVVKSEVDLSNLGGN